MKLLWVKAGGLLPPDMGGKIRSYNILKQLASQHEITLFTFYPNHPDDQHLRGNGFFANIVPVPLPLPPRRSLAEYIRSARLMAAGRPVTIDKFLYPEVRRRYAELLASSSFDAIVCDFLVPASLMHWKTPPPCLPWSTRATPRDRSCSCNCLRFPSNSSTPAATAPGARTAKSPPSSSHPSPSTWTK